MPPGEPRAPLLARRIPVADIVPGQAYVIHARNGGVGVALRHRDQLGYALHREKFGRHYLFVEWDWDQGEPFGTAIPLSRVEESPPADATGLLGRAGGESLPPGDEARLLEWLSVQEDLHRAEIDGAWAVVLGRRPGR